MKRFALLGAIAIAACSVAGTASAAGSFAVRPVKGPGFPVRTFVISLPTSGHLSTKDVSVHENGQPVHDPKVVPASKASKSTFGVVLVLDTSYSMRGQPIAAAITAAQAFVAQRNSNEQVGLIQFNRESKIALPLTTSPGEIGAALAKPPAIATGTHIFDAVSQAEAMLSAAHITSGSIVVLSDGADTGSAETIHKVAQTARRSKMRIYTVGLNDSSYKPQTLKALAHAGNGQYAQAKAGALAGLFDQLSRQLSSEYLLQYKSFLGPNVLASVDIRVKGFGASNNKYRTPHLLGTTPAPPTKPSVESRVWTSNITMIVLAAVVAAALGFLIIGVLVPRGSGLPARMAEFVSIRGLQRDKGEASVSETEGAAPHKDFWKRFEETLEIAEIKVEPEWIVAGTFTVMALAFLLIYAATGSPWWSLFALVIPYLSREWVMRTLKRRRNRFAEQLPDALQVIASALRSGHSLAGALAVVVESASEPMKSEMQRVVADEQLGIPIQNSLSVVAERMASSDVEQLALVAQLQREAGGDAAEVVDRVAETVRERFDLKRLIETLTMQGRMSRWIVSALPIVIVLVIRLENPHYFHPLVASLGGRIVLGLATAWAVTGSFVIKKIVEIEV